MQQKHTKWYSLFFLAVLVFVLLVHFNGLYGQDSYEYLRYAKCIKAFIRTGANPGDYFWPMLYPITGAVFSFLVPLPIAMQLISILALVLSATYLEKIIALLYPTRKVSATIYIFLFFLLSPYMLRGSIVVMADSLTILCLVAGVYYFEQYKKIMTTKYFLGFVFFFAAAVSTRYAAFVVEVPFIIIAAFISFRNLKLSALFASMGIVFILFLPHIIIRSQSPFQFIHHEWFDTWSPFNLFRNRFNTSDGYSSYFFDNLVYAFFNVFHPAFCFAGIAFLFAFSRLGYKRWKSSNLSPYIISALLYALFMAGIPFQDMRYLLLSFPFILILLFQGYEFVVQQLKDKKVWRYALLVTIVIQLVLFCRVFIPFYNDNKIERSISDKMLKYANSTLCTFSIDGALKSYGYNGKIINMALVRIDTLPKIDTGFLVLFNTSQFSGAWKDANPMKNWEFLTKKYSLDKLEDMPDGWALYQNHRSLKK